MKPTATLLMALSTNIGHYIRRPTAVFGLAAATALGSLVTANPVQAVDSTFTKSIITSPPGWNLAFDVEGASKSNGARVILWWSTGNANQRWTFEQTGKVSNNRNIYRIRNVNSGKCLTTNGIAGAQLYQYTCIADYPYQEWATSMGSNAISVYTIWNRTFNLYIDVLGNKFSPGAAVGVWYSSGNQALNQSFF
jgi:Ricin-type beta-trefoil lectin domain-like